MLLNGQSGGGVNQYADGAQPVVRLGRSGEQSVSDLMPRYYELAKRGLLWLATTPAAGNGNMAAANVSPLAAGTGQPVLGLYNPGGSGVELVILKAWFATVSGTPGGSAFWNAISTPAGITAAGSQAINPYTFQTGGKAKVFVNTALTGSLVATNLGPLAGVRAVAAAAGEGNGLEDVGGDLIIQPGAFAGIAVGAAGTTWVAVAGILYAELPI